VVLQTYAKMVPEVAIAHLQTTKDGLLHDEAASRLHIKGKNILTSKKPPTWWQILLSVLPNPFNILLALIAIISVCTPPPAWSTFILLMVMIILSCGVRFWQEYRGSIAAIKLQSGISANVRVRRCTNGLMSEEVTIDETTLVPGDILCLDSGITLPADCMILEATNLQISQSRYVILPNLSRYYHIDLNSLTGESEPLRKTSAPGGEKTDGDLFDLQNLAFMGTAVISGSGLALVLRTGDGKFLQQSALA
jgi:P-type Mg2+ transporter